MSTNYSLVVDGTTYYFSDVNQYNGVVAAKTDEGRLQLIQTYQNDAGGNVTISTDENELAYVDLGAEPAQDVGVNATDDERTSGDYWVTQYADASGLTALTYKESPTLEDMQSVYDQIEAQINSLNSEISSINYNDPESVKEKIAKISGAFAVVNSLVGALGGEVKTGSSGGYIAAGALGTAGVFAASAAGHTIVGAGATAVLMKFGVAASTAGPVGIGIGVVCGLAAVGCWAWNYFSNKDAEKQLADLLEKAEEKRDNLEQKGNEVCNFYKSNAETVIQNQTLSIKDFLNAESFDFQSMTASDISKTLDSVKDVHDTILPYIEAAQSLGIALNIDDKTAQILGSKENYTQYMQSYIDGYANQVSIDLEQGAVSATTESVTMYDDIVELIKTVGGDKHGLNTDSLVDLLAKIKTDNQNVVDDDAGGLNPGGTPSGDGVDLGGNAGNYSLAGDNKTGVDDASSDGEYDVDTSGYEDAQNENVQAAREAIEEYLGSISTEGKSMEELEALYKEIDENKTSNQKYADELGISLKGFDDAKKRVKEAEQMIVDEYLSSKNPYAMTSESELDALENELNAKRGSFSSIEGLNLSGFDKIFSDIEGAREEIRRLNENTGNTASQGGSGANPSNPAIPSTFEGFDTGDSDTPVREQIKKYLDSITLEGKSKKELQQLYRDVYQARGEAMAYAGFDDFSRFDAILGRIEEAIQNYDTQTEPTRLSFVPKQPSKREELQEFLDSIPPLTDLSRRELVSLRSTVLSVRNEYAQYDGFDDFSAIDMLLERIDEAIDATYDTGTTQTNGYVPSEPSMREEMDEFFDSVPPLTDLSLSELKALKRKVISTMNEYAQYDGFDDFSRFDGLIKRIDDAIENYDTGTTQTSGYVPSEPSMREKMDEFFNSIPPLTDLSRSELVSLRSTVLSKRNEYAQYDGFDDFSRFDGLIKRIDDAIAMYDAEPAAASNEASTGEPRAETGEIPADETPAARNVETYSDETVSAPQSTEVLTDEAPADQYVEVPQEEAPSVPQNEEAPAEENVSGENPGDEIEIIVDEE